MLLKWRIIFHGVVSAHALCGVACEEDPGEGVRSHCVLVDFLEYLGSWLGVQSSISWDGVGPRACGLVGGGSDYGVLHQCVLQLRGLSSSFDSSSSIKPTSCSSSLLSGCSGCPTCETALCPKRNADSR